MIYLRLFYEFAKTGLFAIGGGMVTWPFLYRIAESTGWFTAELVTNMIAVAESTPGPIGINMATYAGFTAAGIPGALAATLGIVFPSVVIIELIASMMQKFRQNRYVDAGFHTLRPAVMALMATAGWSVMRIALLNFDLYADTGNPLSLLDFRRLGLFAALALVSWKFKKLHPVVLIALSAAVGILLQM